MAQKFLLTYVLKHSYWIGGRNHDPDPDLDVVEFDTTLQLYNNGTLKIEQMGDIFKMFMYLLYDINPQDVPQTDGHSYFESILENKMLSVRITGQWFVIRFIPDSTAHYGHFDFKWASPYKVSTVWSKIFLCPPKGHLGTGVGPLISSGLSYPYLLWEWNQ